jgi:hypothetical protein
MEDYIPFNAPKLLADIQAHLRSGGSVMIATYTKATVYEPKHLSAFTGNAKDVFVQRGKRKECINYCAIKFGRMVQN